MTTEAIVALIETSELMFKPSQPRLSAPIIVHLTTAPSILTSGTRSWRTVIVEESDWDTAEEVRKLNQANAHYNSITLERVLKILEQKINFTGC